MKIIRLFSVFVLLIVSCQAAFADVTLQAKALLQGAYDTPSGLMRDDLRSKGYLPTTQPYNFPPFNYTGSETASAAVLAVTGAKAVVDWVLLDVRDNTSHALLARKAVLVQRDGGLLDPQTGSSTLSFTGIEAGTYSVSLHHRNHLGTIVDAVALSAATPLLDFTTTGQLPAGDVDANAKVISSGPSNDVTILLGYILTEPQNTQQSANYRLNGYFNTDLNLDGVTVYAGPNNDLNLLQSNVLLHPNNLSFSMNFIVDGVKLGHTFAAPSAMTALTLDTDNDGEADVADTDDDGDNVADNDDYRPLDSAVSIMPTHSGRILSTAQTYVKKASADANFVSDNALFVRQHSSGQGFASLLYFNIPATLDGERVDDISKATLTLKSVDVAARLNITGSTANAFPSAATATWNNAMSLFDPTSYGQTPITAGSSASVVLSQPVSGGNIVFAVDEDSNTKKSLLKDSNAIYLDLEFKQIDAEIVEVTQVADSQATQSGGQLVYQVKLTQAPTDNVYVPIVLGNAATATITSSDVLTFTPANWNTAQTIVIAGKDDGLNQGTKDNHLLVYPLHSNDSQFNGNNPVDHDFNVYAALTAAQSGQAYTAQADYKAKANTRYSLQGAPVGMSINEKTGKIYWQPDGSEAGSYDFHIVAMENGATVYDKAVHLAVEGSASNPTDGFYVVVNGLITNPVGALGSIGNPYTSIANALTAASNDASKRKVYVRGGRYDLGRTDVSIDNVDGTEGNEVTLTRLPGERVKFEFSGIQAFDITKNASYVVIDGFEIDGNATVDHWEMLRSHWWKPLGDRDIGGGQGFDVDGQHITIRNNVIHDAYQKAVNIYAGRYVNVHNNVIYNIGHTSLSGGHGIMRKWERNFHINPTDGVDLGEDVYTSTYPYRFDITGNMLLAVEQRIYSRVFSKGYSLLVLDEGKPILTDETQDTDPKSRISQNLVLYGGVDHIRLKKNPNMEVHNNSILPDLNRTDKPDGITDKSKLDNLKFYGNLIASKGIAVDLDDSFIVNGADEDSSKTRKYANYIGGGGTFTSNLLGVTNLGADVNSLFSNVASNDFHSVVTDPAGVPVGVSDAHLASMMALVDEYAIELTPSGWMNDHLRNAETLVENVPKKVFDRSTYYVGPSSIEDGHQALFIKFVDSDGQWLYNKLETGGGSWGGLANADLTDDSLYDLDGVKIQKCDTCTGAYVFQLVLPHEWFDHYGNAGKTPFTITNSDGTTTNVRYLDPENNAEHKAILEYSAAGAVKSY